MVRRTERRTGWLLPPRFFLCSLSPQSARARLWFSDRKNLEGVSGIRHNHRLTILSVDQSQACRIAGGQEATLSRRYWNKTTPAVAFQPQSIARIGTRSVWLSVVQVPRHQQVEITIPVQVANDHRFDRRNLREIWQRERGEGPAAGITKIDTGESVHLIVKRLL